MVEVVYQDLSNNDFRNYYIGIPKDWKYGKDNDVTVVVSDVCVVIPQTIAGATGELIVLRTLEAMMDANVINAGDIQKAIHREVCCFLEKVSCVRSEMNRIDKDSKSGRQEL